MKGKNDATTFLPKTDKKGGTFIKVVKNKQSKSYSLEEPTEFVTKGKCWKRHKYQHNKTRNYTNKISRARQTYQKTILTDINKKKDPTQMEEWSILSNHVRYITHYESEAFTD